LAFAIRITMSHQHGRYLVCKQNGRGLKQSARLFNFKSGNHFSVHQIIRHSVISKGWQFPHWLMKATGSEYQHFESTV